MTRGVVGVTQAGRALCVPPPVQHKGRRWVHRGSMAAMSAGGCRWLAGWLTVATAGCRSQLHAPPSTWPLKEMGSPASCSWPTQAASSCAVGHMWASLKAHMDCRPLSSKLAGWCPLVLIPSWPPPLRPWRPFLSFFLSATEQQAGRLAGDGSSSAAERRAVTRTTAQHSTVQCRSRR